jgi:hypothetical protein
MDADAKDQGRHCDMTQNEMAGDGWVGQWSPGIGDPTIMGWLTVALYAVAAWQCYRLVTTPSGLRGRREVTLWRILAFALLALGINKQLDLQTALTEIGRIVAHRQGWYERRREVQIKFIYSVGAFAGFTAIALAFLARKAPLATILALFGCVCLLAFVVIRATSFERVDLFIRSEYFGFRMNWVLEMGGICIIIAGARWRLRTG